MLVGYKTYALAAFAAVTFWGANLGVIPPEVATPIQEWMGLLMTGTVGAKIFRVATGRDV